MNEGSGINRRIIDQLRSGLTLPGTPGPRPNTEFQHAAVLVPIFERDGDLHITYIRRSEKVETHRGQVAFPGGRFDPSDENLLRTALREAHEEVGIDPASVEVLGGFPGDVTRNGGFHVTPFVGMIPASLVMRADPREVAEIFTVPLGALSDLRYRGTYRWAGRDGGPLTDYPAILYASQIIWGLTLRFTEDLLRLMGIVRP